MQKKRSWFLLRLVCLCALLVAPRAAQACGASSATGGVAVCTVAEIREKERPKWHVGAAYSWTTTKIHFTGGDLPEKAIYKQQRQTVSSSLEWRPTPRWNFQVAAGALVRGKLQYDSGADIQDTSYPLSLAPGPLFALGTSYLITPGKGAIPFGLLTGQLAGVFSKTDDQKRYTAFDLRLGGALGWRLGKYIMPYFLGRVFGGPISWQIAGQNVRGTDRYHYQLGLGASAVVLGRLDLFVEGVPLGERGISAGAGWAF